MAGERKITVVFDGKDVGLKEAAHAAAGEIDKAGKGISGTFADIGKAAAGFITADVISKGFGMVQDFVSGSVEAYKEAAKADAQLNAVLQSTHGAAGMTADSVKDLASSLEKTTNFADDAIEASSSLLLTFTNIHKDVFPDAQKAVLDMSQALGQDLKSSSIQLGKALNDPAKGLTALKRVGVSFTAEQVRQIKTMQEHGDVAGAQRLILKELNTEFGGSAEAAVKADGGITQMANSMNNLQEKLGQKLLPAQVAFKKAQLEVAQFLVDKAVPAVEKFAHSVGERLHPYIQKATPVLKEMFDKVKDFVTGVDWGKIGADIMSFLKPVVDALKNDLLPATEDWGKTVAKLWADHDWKKIWDEVGPIIEKVAGIIVSLSVLHIEVIAKMMEATAKFINKLQEFWDKHENVRKAVKQIWDDIKTFILLNLDLMKGEIDAIIALIHGDWSGAWRAFWGALKEDAAPVINWVVDQINNLVSIWNKTLGRLPGMPNLSPVSHIATGGPVVRPTKSFASGGLAFGPTLAVVGDNPNAARDPEVTAPLSALQSMGLGGGGPVHLVIDSAGSRLDDVLVEILRKAIRNRGGLTATFG